MSKIKSQYRLEQQIMCMIYRLIEKKLSKIFRQPVDPIAIPDYYEKIKKPIDLSTMIKKLKEGKYKYAVEVRDDLDLMMANCKQFNVHIETIRIAEKFQSSIKTQWTNFQKYVKQKDIDINSEIVITEEVLKNFEVIEDKNLNRKPNNLQSVLGELQISNKKAVPQYRILPPIPQELIVNDKGENDLPKQFAYNPVKYLSMRSEDKKALMQVKISQEEVIHSFEEISQKKLAKYKKILYNKVTWIDTKIIKKCLERRRFKKMSTPQHLSLYIENGEIANNLQLRKLQMYVKMVAYWIEEYPTILSYSMKNKFIEACRSIKRCIFRVLRYKKMPRSTKISLDLENDQRQSNIDFREQMLGEEQARRYDNEIKSFKRMLSKDQGETIKKFTKIQIKNENGQFTVVDWNVQNNDKKKTSRSSVISRVQQNTEEALRQQKERRKREEKQEDIGFLKTFRPRSNLDLLSSYQEYLWIDWDQIRNRKNPQPLEIIIPQRLIVV